ncbi:MAG: BLUF domain-containing protein [Lewinellaceae bacterium]|nr:BLUF domain-containing protein [Lewinellaceae bacterium]
MKRIIYISRLTNPLSVKEMEQIGITSSQNNRALDITGLLVYFERLFFQIIEGDDKKVDHLFMKIGQDPRHQDIVRLKTDYDVDQRLFPAWSMKTINLDSNVDELVRPIKILLQAVTESHTIIEQYTQPTILKILNQGVNPLGVIPIRVEKIILFSDIVSYSAISERSTIEDVFLILNTYFEICSRIILGKGGEVNKLLGDGLMAYFDVEQADDSIEACLDIARELQNLRKNAAAHSPLRLLNSGFGLAQGTVIEGNMGSNFKTDYTVIGDAVNTASRLEGLTREVNRSLVLSESLKQSTKKPWVFVSLGKYSLKGKEKNTEVYSIEHDLVTSLKDI